jgi:hypothetical protein
VKISFETALRFLASTAFIFFIGASVAAQTIFDQDIGILESDQSGVTLRYTVPDYSIQPFAVGEAQFNNLHIPRTAQTRREGQVEIPVKYVPLAVPPGAEVSITVLEASYSDIGFRQLLPFFIRHTLEAYEQAFSSAAARNPIIPQSNPYVASVDEIRGLNVVRVAIPTARYSPPSQSLSILEDIVVRVDFNAAGKETDTEYRYPGAAFERILGKTVANYKQGRDWFTARSSEPNLLTAAVSAFDSSDTWIKIELLSEGIYKFGWLEFNAAGINPLSVDPDEIRIFYGGGRELPLSNFDPRPQLSEIPIEILGGDDGQFDNGDYVVFYADAVDSWEYSDTFGRYQHYRNHYTGRNVYWLTTGGTFSGPSLRFSVTDGAPGGSYDVAVDAFESDYHKEEEWIFYRPSPISELENYFDWYWGYSSDFTTSAQLFDVVPGEEALIVVRQRNGNPYLKVNNGAPLPPSTVGNFSSYVTDNLSNGLNSLNLESSGEFYLDYIDLHYKRWLNLIDGNLLFAQPDTFGTIRYTLSGASSPYILLDISDRNSPVKITGGELDGEDLTFHDEIPGDSHRRYYISTIQRLKTPSAVALYDMDDIRDPASPQNRADEVIITHDAFYDQALALADLREQEYDLITRVVRISDIYNQFSFGLVDAVAIRDFLKYAYENWGQPAPTFALLLGDGHYDYRNNLGTNSANFIPPFENDDQMTDDHYIYFGATGDPDYDDSGGPDMMIGRIPAYSAQDAEEMVGKISDYDADPDLGSWRNKVVVAADDNITPRGPYERFHTQQAETLTNSHVPSSFEVGKIYLIEYPMKNFEKPDAREALIGAFNKGALIVDWIGHGSPGLWADEHIFRRSEDIPRLTNGKKLPLIFTASCSIGFFDDPSIESFGEELLRKRSRGGVSIISATRAVFAGPNIAFNNEVFDQLLYSDSVTIGEAMYIAKYLRGPNSTQRNDRYYVIFGDPAQILQFPKFDVRFTSSPDSLVALSENEVSGEVVDNAGNLMSDFNGTAWVTVKDGTINRSVLLLDRYNNPLSPPNNTLSFLAPGATIFVGPVDVTNGSFSTRFFVPKDVSYGSQGAKIYAYAENGDYDAVGVVDSILVSGSVPAVQDSVGPEIRLYADGRPFTAGVTMVRTGFVLTAEIEDEHGVNITGQLGHGIVVKVDEGDLYETDVTGNFSYDRGGFRSGSLEIGLPEFPLGDHDISLKAWDNFNNSSLVTARMEVVSVDGLELSEVMNYPNPVKSGDSRTSFQYCLNNDVDHVTIRIFTESGRKIKTIEISAPDQRTEMGCHLVDWNLRDADGDWISNGVYIYQVKAGGRSLDGKEVKAHEDRKLVILR